MHDQVGDGIQRFHSHFVNWYLVTDGDRALAIDAGLPPDYERLERSLDGRRLEAVVLTHAHVDHLGFAERARRDLGARVYIHEEDAFLVSNATSVAPHERNPLRYAVNSSARSAMAAMLITAAFRAKPVRDVTTYTDGDVLDVVGSPRVLHTPGHTFGESCLLFADRGVLFTGDTLVTCNPYTGRVGPQIISRAATANSQLALRSLGRIADSGVQTLLPGHGEAWHGSPAEAVRLAREAGPS